jgi:NAD(P)-dependent dehydrogenase (short-subunit alcohol dehydrogenase family)
LGFGVSKALAEQGYRVVLKARKPEAAAVAAQELAREDLDVAHFKLDVTNAAEAARLAAFINEHYERIDALVNNAGVLPDGRSTPDYSVMMADPALVLKTFDTNTLGALRVTQALLPLMKAQGSGNIVNVSSGMGALTDMRGGSPAYRLSKTALNALTRVFAAELEGTGIKINSVCPGWVRTELGGPHATRSVEDGVKGILWAAMLGEDGPSGGFFRDAQPIDW